MAFNNLPGASGNDSGFDLTQFNFAAGGNMPMYPDAKNGGVNNMDLQNLWNNGAAQQASGQGTNEQADFMGSDIIA